MVERHLAVTGSKKAERLLNDWDNSVNKFWQLVPPSEKENPVVCGQDPWEEVRISSSSLENDLCFLESESGMDCGEAEGSEKETAAVV